MGGFIALAALLAPASLPAASPEPGVKIVKEKGRIDFFVGKDLVTSYHISDANSKPIFWPVNPLPGKTVTRSWPIVKDGDEKKDHPHHRSLWFCHGDVLPEGVKVPRAGDKRVKGVDFWSEAPNHGNIVCVEVGEPKDGTIVTKNEWRAPDDKKIMDETRTISMHVLGKNRVLMVLDIELKASVCPITFEDTKEGAMGTRVRKTIAMDTSKEGKMVNDRGEGGEKLIWSKVANWCDYSGPLGPDAPVGGITIMAHPKNPIDTAWHSRNYGLMAANPFAREKSFPGRKGKTDLVKIKKGDTLRLRYGVFLHAGDVKEGKVAEAYAAFGKMK
jgi:hypothetical protein